MKVVVPNCPRCGAPLVITPEQSQVTCTYCELVSMVERDNVPLSRQNAQAPTVYVSKPSLKPIYLTCASIGLSLLIGGIFALVANSRSTTNVNVQPASSPTAESAGKPAPFYFYDRPMLADVNRDGHVDVVGMCLQPGNDTRKFIGAFDGKTGVRLWATETLTNDQQDSYAIRAVVGDKVISIDGLGKVQAYDLVSGNPAWASLISDRAKRICESAGQVVVTAQDGSVTGFTVASGEKHALVKDTRCRDVYSSDDDQAPTYSIIGWSDLEKRGLPGLHAIDGLDAHRALVPTEGNIAFLYGSPSQGTSVATVAAVASRKVLWKSVVPGIEPLRTRINVTTQKATYASGRLVMPYEMNDSDQGVRVAALDAITGRRLWDVQLYKGAHQSLRGISTSSDLVYVTTWSNLYALNLADGSSRFCIGHTQ